eukprot:CAMPEP_0201566476 /NCGR_PEP_ID=MMETSP0190_2-20130828/6271_1 /ASSEMBLY_ACC=CAM_ASM_000263 /TAXON_ID=37353 /ORGANISM="Rosalina sp." /LENGTH=101 /DNA_ID=CAMNT_0047985241 /DNA_START=87 /DNA_END=392 /DNA_ORIENTATION=+
MDLNSIQRTIASSQKNIDQVQQNLVQTINPSLNSQSKLKMAALKLTIATKALEMYQSNITEQNKTKKEEEAQYYAGMGEYYPPGWNVNDTEEGKTEVENDW